MLELKIQSILDVITLYPFSVNEFGKKCILYHLTKEYMYCYYYDIKARKNIGGQMIKMNKTVGVVRERERERAID